MNLQVILMLLGCTAVCCDTLGLVVETDNGKITGTILKTKTGQKIYAFMGIPFAEAPIGPLRFHPPAKKTAWKNILDCTKPRSICPQENFYSQPGKIRGSEDCLYLNIYSPKLQDDKLLPVMIYIHEGAYAIGSGNLAFKNPKNLVSNGIVLATFNYRLGALGFLSTLDSVAPGNNGLKDQNFAIKWVKRNIQKFGGDPKNIILFGQSVGGASVHLQMLSPLSKGLFHGAISQSGTALTRWGLDTKFQTVNNSKLLAEILNCPIESSQQMIDCLRKVEASEFVKNNRRLLKWDIEPTVRFGPVIEPNSEEAFLIQHPVDIIRSGKAMEIPWIVGSTTEDGAIRVAGIYNNSDKVKEFNDGFNQISPIIFIYSRNDNVSNKIRKFYFEDNAINNSTRYNFVNMFTDGRYLTGTHEAVRIHTKFTKQPVYYYMFGYRGAQSYTTKFGDPSENYGVCHGDELFYLFPEDNNDDQGFKKPDVFDEYFTELMATLWTNFAKNLNPTMNAPNHIIPSIWHPATPDNMDCYYIGRDIHMAQGIRADRAKFWRSLNLHASNGV